MNEKNPGRLPMPLKKGGSAMLPLAEWREYRRRRAAHLKLFPRYDGWWRRPPLQLSCEVWHLLVGTGLPDHALLPSIAKRLTPVERAELDGTLAQALTIAAEVFVTAGRDGTYPTVNRLFDGLASGWSDHYRAVKQAGLADRARDMKPGTLIAARRDLLRWGIDVLAFWKVLTAAEWANPLFTTTLKVSTGRDGRVKRTQEVVLWEGTAELEWFRTALVTHGKWEQTRAGWTLLPADDAAPARAPRQESCFERPFNVVKNGDNAERAMALQAEARLIFKTDVFMAEYDKTAPNDRIRQQYGGVRDELRTRGLTGDLVVRSRFERLVNRRFSAVDVWPTYTPAKMKDEPWREVIPAQPDGPEPDRPPGVPGWGRSLGHPAFGVVSSPRGRWFQFQHEVDDIERTALLGGLDVGASQTAILAVMLGLDKLEAIASAQSFNTHLAARAWKQRQQVLEDDGRGYDGPTDEKLKELVKQLWMRVAYGAEPAWTALEQMKDADIGPGWKRGSGDSKYRTVTRVAVQFLRKIPEYARVSMFRHACREIAKRVNIYRGFEFRDPLDHGVTVRWNPVQRADTVVSSNGLKLIVSRPGRRGARKKHEDWEPRGAGRTVYRFAQNKPDLVSGDYPIDRRELGTMLAPCFVHAVDAALAAHVVFALREAGAQDIVSINDAWFCQLDEETFRTAVDRATQSWFRQLGVVYDDLARHLPDGARRKLILDAQAKWQARVAAEQWPSFFLKADIPISALQPHNKALI